MSLRIKEIVLGALAMLPTAALAHPGHGLDSVLHGHGAEIALAAVGLIAGVLLLVRRRPLSIRLRFRRRP